MKLKNTMTNQKLRGGYYTPEVISDFLTNWALETSGKSVLEPSCGDGIFLESIFKNKNSKKINEIFAIEYDEQEAKKVSNMITNHPDFKKISNVITGDFFKYYLKNLKNKKFDIILGNPPYIRYQFFNEEQQEMAKKIMSQAGINSNKLINIWAPFLIAGMISLNSGGRLAMVIPGEILQVNYSGDVRLFMSKFPGKITMITFEELIFPDVQQEVVLLMIEKNKNSDNFLEKLNSALINIIQLKNIGSLKDFDLNSVPPLHYKKIHHSNEKWIKYFLSTDELIELEKIQNHSKIKKLGDLANVDVGIVTGANKYFVVDNDTLKKFDLHKFALPLVGRSMHIPGYIFTNNDWVQNTKDGIASYLLDFSIEKFEKYNKKIKGYIKLGEENNIHRGYKTGIRNNWYEIPSIHKSDAFFLRRSHKFPKLILNEAEAYTTDTMHRVKIKDNVELESLLFCFYNSITMASSEIVGRSYGGGVLEILPNDAEDLLIPYAKVNKKHLSTIDKMFRNDTNIEMVFDYVDDIVLSDIFGFSNKSILTCRTIWKKLSARRHERKQSLSS